MKAAPKRRAVLGDIGNVHDQDRAKRTKRDAPQVPVAAAKNATLIAKSAIRAREKALKAKSLKPRVGSTRIPLKSTTAQPSSAASSIPMMSIGTRTNYKHVQSKIHSLPDASESSRRSSRNSVMISHSLLNESREDMMVLDEPTMVADQPSMHVVKRKVSSQSSNVSSIKLVPSSSKKSLAVIRQAKTQVRDDDFLLVNEYEKDIFDYLRKLEVKMMPSKDYMNRQAELDHGMRAKLVSWLMQVHSHFKLLPETLYIAINILDRFFSLKSVSVGRLQLAGIVSLLIASKFEEIMSPSISDLIYMYLIIT